MLQEEILNDNGDINDNQHYSSNNSNNSNISKGRISDLETIFSKLFPQKQNEIITIACPPAFKQDRKICILYDDLYNEYYLTVYNARVTYVPLTGSVQYIIDTYSHLKVKEDTDGIITIVGELVESNNELLSNGVLMCKLVFTPKNDRYTVEFFDEINNHFKSTINKFFKYIKSFYDKKYGDTFERVCSFIIWRHKEKNL